MIWGVECCGGTWIAEGWVCGMHAWTVAEFELLADVQREIDSLHGGVKAAEEQADEDRQRLGFTLTDLC